MVLEFDNLKMVFALLTKVITFHMQMTKVEIEVPGFERLVKFVPSFAY